MAHTPGPWTAPEGPFVGGHYVGTEDADIAERADWPLEFTAEQEANARLIAAAPELYEALERLLVEHDGNYRTSTAVDAARAAIAKARGEA